MTADPYPKLFSDLHQWLTVRMPVVPPWGRRAAGVTCGALLVTALEPPEGPLGHRSGISQDSPISGGRGTLSEEEYQQAKAKVLVTWTAGPGGAGPPCGSAADTPNRGGHACGDGGTRKSGSLELSEVAEPEVESGSMVVESLAVGVSSTDAEIADGQSAGVVAAGGLVRLTGVGSLTGAGPRAASRTGSPRGPFCGTSRPSAPSMPTADTTTWPPGSSPEPTGAGWKDL